MTSGSRKNPYRVRTEYGDNLRRREERTMRMHIIAGGLAIFIGIMLGVYIGVRLFF